jgi:endonuclease III
MGARKRIAAVKGVAKKAAANRLVKNSKVPGAMNKTTAKKPAAKRAARKVRIPQPPGPATPVTPADAGTVLRRLRRAYPDAKCALEHRNPFELLCATILSAQSTDKGVNLVTPRLFARYPDAESLADADAQELEEIIHSTGFFRAKAKSLMGMARALVDAHGGEVPREMDALVELPGVGRKTANVVLGNAFGINEGIVVDTHVTRVSGRLGLTSHTDAVKIEKDLVPLFPRKDWTMISHYFIEHGRKVCVARRPRCEECVLSDVCPSSLAYGAGRG